MRKGEKWGEEGEKKERGQARELKSLVASPLYWLPRDQQGAKSTRGGGGEMDVFQRKGKRREKKNRDGEWWGQEAADVYLGCVSPLLSLSAHLYS